MKVEGGWKRAMSFVRQGSRNASATLDEQKVQQELPHSITRLTAQPLYIPSASPAWMSLSFWDKYLAPGDIRRQRQLEAAAAPKPQDEIPQAITQPTTTPRIDRAHRTRRKDALFYGGITFTVLSFIVTKRAIRRRQLQVVPQEFTPSNAPAPEVNGGLEAVEALGLATLLSTSALMAAIGAGMKIFDIADLQDMRDIVKRGQGHDLYGGVPETDKEMEEWMTGVLSQKDGGKADLQGEIVKKLAELEELEKARKSTVDDKSR